MADKFYESMLNSEDDEKTLERRKARQLEMENRQKKQEKRDNFFLGAKKLRKFFIIAIAALALVAALLGKSIYRIAELQKEKANAQAQLDELSRKISEMEYELNRVTSDEYIEQQARMKLRMIKPGETLYVIE